MSNQREEWLIVLFRRLGKPHCKQGPWQHPYSGYMAKTTICLLRTSETRKPVWSGGTQMNRFCWWISFIGRAGLSLGKFYHCCSWSRQTLQRRAELSAQPRAERGLTFLCSETTVCLFFWSNWDCLKEILYPQWVVKGTADLPGMAKVLKANYGSEIQKNERHLEVQSVGLQPRKLPLRALFLVTSFDSVVLTEQYWAPEGEKHGVCIWYKEAGWSSWVGLDRTPLVARRGRKEEKAHWFLWGLVKFYSDTLQRF